MLVVDVETTGLTPHRNSIVSIGAIDFTDPTRRFYAECQPWDGAEIDAGALAANGYTKEQLLDPDRPLLSDVMKQFVTWAGQTDDQTIGGQYITFDLGFLRDSAKRCNLDWWPRHRSIDLQTVAYVHFLKRGTMPPASLTLDVIAIYVGLPAEPKPHIASNGAAWEAESLARLIYGRNHLTEFSQYPLPDYLQNAL
jgi:DNA polymerase III epsilon subunit-like protein